MEKQPKFVEMTILTTDNMKVYFQSEIEFLNWFRVNHHSWIEIENIPIVTYNVDGKNINLKVDKNGEIWTVSNYHENEKEKIDFNFECDKGPDLYLKLRTELKKKLNLDL